jgi:hypothetical protein
LKSSDVVDDTVLKRLLQTVIQLMDKNKMSSFELCIDRNVNYDFPLTACNVRLVDYNHNQLDAIATNDGREIHANIGHLDPNIEDPIPS